MTEEVKYGTLFVQVDVQLFDVEQSQLQLAQLQDISFLYEG